MTKDQESSNRIVSETVAHVKGDKIVTTVVETGDHGVIVGQQYRRWNGQNLSRFCGWCDGVSIGCVECLDNESAILDCVKREIRCAPMASTGWRIGGLFLASP